MDQLEKKEQEKIRKMSDARLISMLSRAGVETDEIDSMDRATMIDQWAKLVLTGNDTRPAATTGGATGTTGLVGSGYDVNFEREKLAFEREKFEYDKRRQTVEDQFKEEQIRVQRDQLAMDLRRQEAKVFKLKQYGDALRNSMSKLGDNSPLEFIPFINNFERLLKELTVPNELRVPLLTPYLSDKCRSLLNRLQGNDATSYDYVKTYLMQQLRLVPSYFVDEFNRIVRQPSETFKSYINRLSALLLYYTESRDVKDFESLFQLLLCDRVKASLHEGALGHLLRYESTLSNKWANVDQLSDVLDTYYANYDRFDKPKVSAIGAINTQRTGAQLSNARDYSRSQDFRHSSVKPENRSKATDASQTPVQYNSKPRKMDLADMECFKCGLKGHLRASCLGKVSQNNSGSNFNKQVKMVRVFFVVMCHVRQQICRPRFKLNNMLILAYVILVCMNGEILLTVCMK